MLSKKIRVLLSRDRAIKPVDIQDEHLGFYSLCCKSCKSPIANSWVRGHKPKFCQECGQRINWEGIRL